MPPMWGWALPRLFSGLPRVAGQVLAVQGCSPGLLLLHAALPGALLDGDDHAAGLRAKHPATKTLPGPLIRAKRPQAGKLHSSALSRTQGAMERLGQGQARLEAVGKLGWIGKGAVQQPKRWPQGEGYPWAGWRGEPRGARGGRSGAGGC